MKTTSFTEFRKHAAEFLDAVEKGEIVRILRHGKPVADITPIPQESGLSWKKTPPPISLRGASLSKAIMENRKETKR